MQQERQVLEAGELRAVGVAEQQVDDVLALAQLGRSRVVDSAAVPQRRAVGILGFGLGFGLGLGLGLRLGLRLRLALGLGLGFGFGSVLASCSRQSIESSGLS